MTNRETFGRVRSRVKNKDRENMIFVQKTPASTPYVPTLPSPTSTAAFLIDISI